MLKIQRPKREGGCSLVRGFMDLWFCKEAGRDSGDIFAGVKLCKKSRKTIFFRFESVNGF